MENLETVKRYRLYWFLIFVFIVILRLVTFRSGFSNIDENEYAIAAHKILEGGLPYRDFLIYQPPVIYYFYALSFLVFGSKTLIGAHIFLLFVIAASAFVIGKTSHILFESERASLVAGFFYAIISFSFLPQDMLAANCEILAVLPISLAAFFYVKYEKQSKNYNLLLSGIFIGFSALTKYQCGIILVPILIILLFRRREILSAMTVVAGMLMPVAAVTLYLYFAGAWVETKDAWLYILKYAKGPVQCDLCYVFIKFIVRTLLFAASGFFIWQFAVRWLKESIKFSPFLFIWFLLSFTPVLMGGRIYFHYYFVILPPLVLLATGGVLKLKTGRFFFRLMLVVQMVFVAGWFVYDYLKPVRPFGPKDSWVFVADYLKDKAEPNETLFVWGYAPQIYIRSGLKSSTRFTTSDYLTGRTPMTAGLEYDPEGENIPSCFEKVINDFRDPDGVVIFDTSKNIFPKAWGYLKDDFSKGLPDYFVDTAPSNYRRYGRYPVEKYSYLQDVLKSNYQLETEIKGFKIYRLKKG